MRSVFTSLGVKQFLSLAMGYWILGRNTYRPYIFSLPARWRKNEQTLKKGMGSPDS